MTIGIIEDDRLLSRSLKVVLEKEGYRTLQVYTKKDAGQILQGTEELLLVDIGLPDGNGMELYHTLMKKWNRKTPAIFLLEYLMKNQGQVLTKENILEHVWGIDGQYVVDNSVSVLVGRLRKKIEAVGEQPYIQNVFGLGYRMEEE